MRGFQLLCIFLILISCAKKDPFSKLNGFWVSVEYQTGKPFQTLSITGPAIDSNYSSFPLGFVEINQYGSYPVTSVMDTVDGVFTVYHSDWYVNFILRLEGDTLVRELPSTEPGEMKVKYILMDFDKIWREVIFSDLLLQIDLPESNANDLERVKKSLIADLFLGSLKKSILSEYPTIEEDSTVLQVNDVLIGSDELWRFLKAEQAKFAEEDRDSLIVVLNADKKILQCEIDEWAARIKRFNPNLRVWRRTLDLQQRKFRYRDISQGRPQATC